MAENLEVIRSGTDESLFWAKRERGNIKYPIYVKIIDKKNKVLNCAIKITEVDENLNPSVVEVPGIYNITKNADLKKAYKKYLEITKTVPPLFQTEDEFVDFIVEIYKKMKSTDFTILKAKGVTEITPEIESYLSQANLWNKIDTNIRTYSAYHREPLVRDWITLAESFVAILSSKTKDPLNYFCNGPSASGKTYIGIRAAQAFPPEMIDIIGSSSKTAYKYDFDSKDEEGNYIVELGGKCIFILEKSEARELIKQFKSVMSHDVYESKNKVVCKNAVGDMDTRTYIYRDFPSFYIASVQHDDKDEENTRAIRGSPDVSEVKITEAFKARMKAKRSITDFIINEPDISSLKNSLSWLKTQYILNPFSSIIEEIMILSGRNSKKFESITDTWTLLHCMRRPKIKVMRNGKLEQVLFSSFEDNIIALAIFESMYDSIDLGITGLSLELLNLLNDMQSKGHNLTHANILSRCKIEKVPMPTVEDLKEHLTVLVNHNLLGIKTHGGRNVDQTYDVVKNKKFERKRLVPLFIETVANKLPILVGDLSIKEYDDVEYPATVKPTSLSGCKFLDYLLEQDYLVDTNKFTPIYFIFGDNYRDDLFNKNHVLEYVSNKYTKEKEKEVRFEKAEADLVRSGVFSTDNEKLYELADKIAEEQEEAYSMAASIGVQEADIIHKKSLEQLQQELENLIKKKGDNFKP